MKRRLSKQVAWLLLPLYCVLAGWGYALHDWAACRDACCSREVQGDASGTCKDARLPQSARSTLTSDKAGTGERAPRGSAANKASGRCSCPSHGRRPEGAKTIDHGQKVVRSKAHGHDEATCSVCHLLAQLKVGYQSLVSTSDMQQVLTEAPAARESIRAQTLLHSGDVRGPPALFS